MKQALIFLLRVLLGVHDLNGRAYTKAERRKRAQAKRPGLVRPSRDN